MSLLRGNTRADPVRRYSNSSTLWCLPTRIIAILVRRAGIDVESPTHAVGLVVEERTIVEDQFGPEMVDEELNGLVQVRHGVRDSGPLREGWGPSDDCQRSTEVCSLLSYHRILGCAPGHRCPACNGGVASRHVPAAPNASCSTRGCRRRTSLHAHPLTAHDPRSSPAALHGHRYGPARHWTRRCRSPGRSPSSGTCRPTTRRCIALRPVSAAHGWFRSLCRQRRHRSSPRGTTRRSRASR